MLCYKSNMGRKRRTQGEGGDVIELVNTSFLIPRHIQRELRIMAAHNERTLSAEIRAALESHVRRDAA